MSFNIAEKASCSMFSIELPIICLMDFKTAGQPSSSHRNQSLQKVINFLFQAQIVKEHQYFYCNFIYKKASLPSGKYPIREN
jgi:hypothetical protein